MPIIKIEMQLHAQTKQEGDWFIARVPDLDIYTQGHTEEEALSNLTEALQLFVESCFEQGTLEQVFRDCGYHTSHHHSLESEINSDDHIINVPLSLVASNAAANHAC